MLVRIRSNVGIWRVEDLDDGTATVSDILDGIKATRPYVQYEKPLSFDPGCNEAIDTTKTLKEQNLRHGSMIHCRVDPSTCAEHTVETAAEAAAAAGNEEDGEHHHKIPHMSNMKRIIDKDGTIKLIPTTEIRNDKDDKGFRKGMMRLRDMKMAWTLNDFIALDSQYEFKIKRQNYAICKQVSLDIPSIHDFQSYLQRFNFQRKRVGWLYGRYVDIDPDDVSMKSEKTNNTSSSYKRSDSLDESKEKFRKKTLVEAIYEPPQDVDPDAAEGFVLLDDPMEDTVDQIAEMLGLVKVGWIFGHPPREQEVQDLPMMDASTSTSKSGGDKDNHKNDFVLSSAEVIMAAELQLEAAGGIEETPFVTVKVTKGSDGNVSVEAFQVSQQCMAMAAEEALQVDGNNPSFCSIHETFTAIQEGKESKTVNNNFFLTVVPIIQHTSDQFVAQFPKCNRDHDDRIQTKDEMKKQLKKSGTSGWTFTDLLSDFNLLIYLSKFLDVNADLPKICQSITNKDIPLDDGYKIIISSLAGLDGSY